MMLPRNVPSLCLAVLLAILLGACTAQWQQIQAWKSSIAGEPEEALSSLDAAQKAAPRDAQIEKDRVSLRQKIVDQKIDEGQRATQEGKLDDAEQAFLGALKLDQRSSRIPAQLDALERKRRISAETEAAAKLAEQGKTEAALEKINKASIESPGDKASKRLQRKLEADLAGESAGIQSLNALYSKPISLELRDVPVTQAIEALARTTNINFVLDKDVRPDLRATLFLRQTYLEDAVNLLLATTKLEKKILNERSVLVYPSDPAKAKEYQDLMVRAFYLDYGDAKQVANTLKTLLKIKEAIPDENLNMILVRDTPEAIALAERVVRLHETPAAEVMLEVEVLEVTRNKLTNLGVQWPALATFAPLSASGGTSLTYNDLKSIPGSRVQVGVGSTTLNLNKTDSDVNILANPRIRVRNKTKAKILIGDKVPIITTTATATGFISEAVQYVEVGLKLDVEPRVMADDDVSIKVGLEVSSIVKEVRSPGGTLAYQIGTRTADTLLKLHDGETQILAGLLNDEERSSGNRIPYLGDVPLLGRLFGSQKDERNKTEIILSITPRIIQPTARPPMATAQFWTGSEATLRTRPLILPSANRRPVTSDETPVTPSAEVAPGKPQEAATEVALSWQAPAAIKAGEIIKIPLRIKTDGAVRSLPFQLGFDPATVDILKVEDGGFFKTETGEASLSFNVDAGSGKLFASLTRSTVDGAQGDGVAAIISVRPKVAGKAVELRLLGATPISLSNQVSASSLPPALTIPVNP